MSKHHNRNSKEKNEKNGRGRESGGQGAQRGRYEKYEKYEKKERVPMLKQETRHLVWGIIFFVLAVFLLLAPFAQGGRAGTALYHLGDTLLGVGFFFVPTLFLLLGAAFTRSVEPEFSRHIALRTGIGSFLFILSGLGMTAIFAGDAAGGMLGKWVAFPLVKFFDAPASVLFLAACFVISLIVIFDARPKMEWLAGMRGFFGKKNGGEMPEENSISDGEITIAETGEMKVGGENNSGAKKESEKENQEAQKNEAAGEVQGRKESPAPEISRKKSEEEKFDEELRGGKRGGVVDFTPKNFVPPPLSLLEKDSGKPGVGDIKANANIIKRTLQNFGINVEMDEVSIGPTVTRYALKPAEGVKLARIIGLTNELSLALAAHPVRVEAPIPGTSRVGIEVPNTAKTTVGLGTLLASPEYQESPHPLCASLGKSISGKSYFGNVAKMPHLLIAGATGSGKSVMVHSLITSLLYRNPPENLRFLMIDPKRVELTLYNGIPHLFTPVITDAKRAIMALRWAAKEMDRRYDILESESVRDIQSYHKNILGKFTAEKTASMGKENGEENLKENASVPAPERMPYVVIIIDELADIMQAYPRELESAIVRLAQMSRAVGIHLMLSTQRPSVNVITGLIKANIPSRIALQVASQIDSRTILDSAGAEKLLGAGDMLYMGGEMSKPVRLQSAYISENEVKKVVNYLVKQYENEVPDEITITDIPDKNAIFSTSLESGDGSGDDDNLYEDARMAVMEAGKASTSYLQRKLKIGYARAARLIDMLEERGVVGAGEGAKPREVLLSAGTATSERAEEMGMGGNSNTPGERLREEE